MKIVGSSGEIRATLVIKRKDTGKEEKVEIVGRVKPKKEEEKGKDNGGNAFDNGAGRGN